jgi:hypothetical protein
MDYLELLGTAVKFICAWNIALPAIAQRVAGSVSAEFEVFRTDGWRRKLRLALVTLGYYPLATPIASAGFWLLRAAKVRVYPHRGVADKLFLAGLLAILAGLAIDIFRSVD